MNIEISKATAGVGGASEFGVSSGFKVDLSRGDRVGRVSSEWFSRPDDERYLSLSDLLAAVRGRSERSHARTVESAAIRVEARRADAERLTLALPGSAAPATPTHWSFGQLCSLVGAPASYLRELPAPLAGVNLQHGLPLAPRRARQDSRSGGRQDRASRGHGPGLRSYLGSRAGCRCDENRWKRHGRHALESARHS